MRSVNGVTDPTALAVGFFFRALVRIFPFCTPTTIRAAFLHFREVVTICWIIFFYFVASVVFLPVPFTTRVDLVVC